MDQSLIGEPLDPNNIKIQTRKIPLDLYLDSYDDSTEYPNTCAIIDVLPQNGVPPSTVEAEFRSIGVDPMNLPLPQHPAGSPYKYPWISRYQAYIDRWRIFHWGEFTAKPFFDKQGNYQGMFVRVVVLIRHSKLETLGANPQEVASLMEEVFKERQLYIKSTRQVVVISLSPTPRHLDLPMGWRQMDYLRMGPSNEKLIVQKWLGIEIKDGWAHERGRVPFEIQKGRVEQEQQKEQDSGKSESSNVSKLRRLLEVENREPCSKQQREKLAMRRGKDKVRPSLPVVDENNCL